MFIRSQLTFLLERITKFLLHYKDLFELYDRSIQIFSRRVLDTHRVRVQRVLTVVGNKPFPIVTLW